MGFNPNVDKCFGRRRSFFRGTSQCLAGAAGWILRAGSDPLSEAVAEEAEVGVELRQVFVGVLEAPGAAEAGVPADVEAAPQVVGVVLARGAENAGFEIAR